MFRIVVRLVLAVAVLSAGCTFALKKRYGGDTIPFASRLAEPELPSTSLEVVAKLDEAPGKIAVSSTGRVFFTFHPEGRPESSKLVELVNGKPVAFPDEEFQAKRSKGPYFDTVLPLRIDNQDRLWTIDPGYHGLRTPRLLAFDIVKRKVTHEFNLSPAAGIGSYIHDFQVTPGGKYVIMADMSPLSLDPALIVYDVNTHDVRRVLESSDATLPKPYAIFSNGHDMSLFGGLYKLHPGVGSITMDQRGIWCYFGPMSHETLFRVAVEDLRVASRANLLLHVEKFGPKPQSAGLTMDTNNSVYLTDVEHNAIHVLGQDRKLRTLVQDERLRWPDGLAFGPDGWLYIADSDLPDLMMQSRDHVKASAPYYIYRIQTGKAGRVGH